MRKGRFVLLLFFWCLWCTGQTIDLEQFRQEVATKQANEAYESAMLLIEEVVLNDESTPLELAYANYYKHLIYRKIGIFTEALTYLNEALVLGRTTTEKEQFEQQFNLDYASLALEQLDYTTSMERVAKIDPKGVGLVKGYQGIYTFLLGVKAMEVDRDYAIARIQFEKAILILEKQQPAYLPYLYKEKMRLHLYLGQDEEVIQSYQIGVALGEQYHGTVEVLQLHHVLMNYYKDKGLYQESMAMSNVMIALFMEFDAIGQSSRLNQLMKELTAVKEEEQRLRDLRTQYILWSSLCIVGVLVLIALIIFTRNNRYKGVVERENQLLKVDFQTIHQQNKEQEESPLLTERQAYILDLVKQGKKNKEIAEKLFISENTVKYHLKIIYETLQVKGRSDLLEGTEQQKNTPPIPKTNSEE